MNADQDSPQQVREVVQKISALVSNLSGIQLGERQFPMVESRLRARMTKLRISTLKDYLAHLEKDVGQESQALLSLLTTHHTFFFREFNQFEELLNRGLPTLVARARERGDRKIRIWSAAASRGQEAYSLAMFMRFHLAATAPDIDFEIWGTDIDPESLQWAKNGVYKASDLKQAPAMYINGQWVRGKGDVSEFVKARDTLKGKCRFETVNLLNPQSFLTNRTFDLIFCRNVFIYFDRDQIRSVTQTLLKHLDEQGLLFVGVTESLTDLGLPLRLLGASIYSHEKTVRSKTPIRAPAPTAQTPRKILCVDDSPVILTLLKKILTPDQGFEVVATAPNGEEALKILRSTKVDAITLDLHMPIMDGVAFLGQPLPLPVPIIVVSSVNRDDLSLAQKALSLGAADYVEKPSLENIAQAGNEIRSKLKMAISYKAPPPKM